MSRHVSAKTLWVSWPKMLYCYNMFIAFVLVYNNQICYSSAVIASYLTRESNFIDNLFIA
jgi:hypothetical protein